MSLQAHYTKMSRQAHYTGQLFESSNIMELNKD